MTVDIAGADGQRIGQPGFLHGFFQATVVRLQIGEMQGIHRSQVVVQGDVFLIVEQDFEVFLRTDGRMVVALRTFVIIVAEGPHGAGFLTAFTLEPNPFRHVLFRLGRRGNAFFQSFKPTHTVLLIDLCGSPGAIFQQTGSKDNAPGGFLPAPFDLEF